MGDRETERQTMRDTYSGEEERAGEARGMTRERRGDDARPVAARVGQSRMKHNAQRVTGGLCGATSRHQNPAGRDIRVVLSGIRR